MEPVIHGHFCWHDCNSSDPDRARDYYRALCGWTAREVPIGARSYTMLVAGDGPEDAFGGLEPLPVPGVPSHWLSYVAVAALDASIGKLDALGGRVLHPRTEIPGMGHFAVVQDPTGATFALYQGNQPAAARTAEQMKPGLPCWMELMVRDPGRAVGFYAELFGWTTVSKDLPDGETYQMFLHGALGVGGVMRTPGPEVPPHWYPYFLTADLAVSAELAASLGGRTCMPPTEIGDGMGSFSVQTDPCGAVFGFYAAPNRTC
jgi:predicted enzyme related to lactoylglutathione lyase